MKKGSALIITMFVCCVLSVIVTSICFLTGNSAYFPKKIHDRNTAIAISEAGIADALSQMQINGIYNISNPIVNNTFAGGSYSVRHVINTNGCIILFSTGIFHKANELTVMEVIGDIWQLYDKILGVDGTIISGGDIILDTSAIDIYGTIHANQNIISLQGHPNIHNSMSAGGTIQGNINCSGDQQSNVQPVVVPDYRPFTDWMTLAKSNGVYCSTNLVINGGSLNPSNGIIYINGNLEIKNNCDINGTLVVSGNVIINNNFKQTSYNTNWPSILAGGSINLYNRNDLYGIIFAGGNIISANKKNIKGALISIGNVEIRNNMDLIPLNHPVQWSPLDTNEIPSQPILGGWLK